VLLVDKSINLFDVLFSLSLVNFPNNVFVCVSKIVEAEISIFRHNRSQFNKSAKTYKIPIETSLSCPFCLFEKKRILCGIPFNFSSHTKNKNQIFMKKPVNLSVKFWIFLLLRHIMLLGNSISNQSR
jgi:hypothetical protein